MATGGYIGVDGIAKKIKKGYVSPDGTARAVKKAYMGIGGVARPIWSGGGKGKLEYYGTITPLSVASYECVGTSIGDYALIGGGRQSGTVLDTYTENLVHSSVNTMDNHQWGSRAGKNSKYALFFGTNSDIVASYDSDLVRSSAQKLPYQAYAPFIGEVSDNVIFNLDSNRSGSGTPYVYRIDSSLVRTEISRLNKSRMTGSYASTDSHCIFFSGGAGTIHYSQYVTSYDSSFVKKELPNLPTQNTYAESFAIGLGSGIIFGGGTRYLIAHATDECYLYDNDLVRTSLEPLSVARGSGSSSKTKNYAIFVGGVDENISSVNTVDAYDSDFVKVQEVESVAYARTMLAGQNIGNYALFCGGNFNATGTNRTTNIVEAYKEV